MEFACRAKWPEAWLPNLARSGRVSAKAWTISRRPRDERNDLRFRPAVLDCALATVPFWNAKALWASAKFRIQLQYVTVAVCRYLWVRTAQDMNCKNHAFDH